MGPYSSATAVAASVPFDNSTNGFTATDVQAAIEEAQLGLWAEIDLNSSQNAPTSEAQLNGMTITGLTGNWKFTFNTDVISATAGAAITASIRKNGTLVPNAQRKIIPFDGGLTSSTTARGMLTLVKVVQNLVSTDVVDVSWQISSGTGTISNRILMWEKVK